MKQNKKNLEAIENSTAEAMKRLAQEEANNRKRNSGMTQDKARRKFEQLAQRLMTVQHDLSDLHNAMTELGLFNIELHENTFAHVRKAITEIMEARERLAYDMRNSEREAERTTTPEPIPAVPPVNVPTYPPFPMNPPFPQPSPSPYREPFYWDNTPTCKSPSKETPRDDTPPTTPSSGIPEVAKPVIFSQTFDTDTQKTQTRQNKACGSPACVNCKEK